MIPLLSKSPIVKVVEPQLLKRIDISTASMHPSSVISPRAYSHVSGTPSRSTSAAPAAISQTFGIPSLSQSAWQESGVPFKSQSFSGVELHSIRTADVRAPFQSFHLPSAKRIVWFSSPSAALGKSFGCPSVQFEYPNASPVDQCHPAEGSTLPIVWTSPIQLLGTDDGKLPAMNAASSAEVIVAR